MNIENCFKSWIISLNMKKYIIIFCSLCILFVSCKLSQKKESKISLENVQEISKENDSKIKDEVDENKENETPQDSIKNDQPKTNTYGWTTIVHGESITFYADKIESPFFNTDLLNVWKDKRAINYSYWPEKYEDQIIYKIQPDDTIKVFEFLTHDNKDQTLLHVECPDGQTGYICYNHNIFTENEYFFQESIEVDGIIKDVYSVSGPVFVRQKEIYALPSANSEIVGELTSTFNYIEKRAKVMAMTNDGEWVKVIIDENDVVGWVPFNKIESGRGGPAIWTPYIKMLWDIFDIYDSI